MTGDAHQRPTARGRPSKRDAVLLRERILQAAIENFMQEGYGGASIESVARLAGVSRTTIYSLYAGKEQLFTAMIHASVLGTDIGTQVAFDDRPPREVLREAMRTLNQAYYNEPNLEIIRLCTGVADRFPDLIRNVREVLGQRLTGLTRYFERLRDAGRLELADCNTAALLFNMLALGTLKPFLIHQSRLTESETAGHLDLALDIFLNGALRDPSDMAVKPSA